MTSLPKNLPTRDLLRVGPDVVLASIDPGASPGFLGDKKAGKAELEVATKKGATDAATHAALGAIALDEGRTGDALKEYELVLGQDKNNAEANAATGHILAQRGNHKQGAAHCSQVDWPPFLHRRAASDLWSWLPLDSAAPGLAI